MTVKHSKIFFLITLIFTLNGCIPIPKTAQTSHLKLAPPAQTIRPAHPPLTCSFKGGTAQFLDGWYDFRPATLTLHSGGKSFALLTRTRKKSTTRLWVSRTPDNQRLIFCPDELAGGTQCRSLYAVEDDFKTGITRTLDVPDRLRGATVHCFYSR